MEYTKKFISKNRLFAIKFTTLTLLTGFIYYFQFSTISILITLTWLLWMYKTYYSYYKLQIPDNLRSHFQYIFDGFKNLRKNKPGVFCGLLSLNFMIIAVLGQLIPGYSALFAILFISLLVSTKYDIQIIRENDDSTPLAEVEEFYPQMDEMNLDILKQIGENADDSALYSNVQEVNSKSMDESDDDSLIPTSADLPNIDDEMEDDDIEIENVGRVPKIDPNEMILTQGVEYKKSHFKSSTSSDSSDEDSITSGLDFSSVPHTVVDYAHPLSQSTPAPLLALQANVARNLVDNLIKSASGAIAGTISGPSHHSSQKSKYLAASSDEDDSDFEILDKDDL